jgi:hypothetical protein
MHARAIGYWTATTLIALETLAGGVADLARGAGMNVVGGAHVAEVVTGLGYPEYLLTLLGLWKIPGALVLLAPRTPRLKEWAYAGIVFELTGAAGSHPAHRDRAREVITPLILAGLALTSWALRPPSRTLAGAGKGAAMAKRSRMRTGAVR